MNSSFVNISSQHGPLCLILPHLSILRLSYGQSKYDKMYLSIKNAAPTIIGAAKRQSTLNMLYHRARSRIFCAVFTVDRMVASQSDRGPAIPGARTSIPEALCNKWVTGSRVGCLSDKVRLVALNLSNGTNNNFSHFQKQCHIIYLQFDNTGVKRNQSWFKFHKTHNKTKHKISRTRTQINMPANSAGWVWQTIRLIQRSWHQHPQHRICSLICFRTVTSYFYEHLPPLNK